MSTDTARKLAMMLFFLAALLAVVRVVMRVLHGGDVDILSLCGAVVAIFLGLYFGKWMPAAPPKP